MKFRCLAISGLLAVSLQPSITHAEEDDATVATRIYLDSIGWPKGKCVESRFNVGLTATCDVSQKEGPDAVPPSRVGTFEDPLSAPLLLSCPRGPDGHLRFFGEIHTQQYLILTGLDLEFQDGLPVKYFSHYFARQEPKVVLKDYFDLVNVPESDKSAAQTYVRTMANIKQFVCDAGGDKQTEYGKLLSYNRDVMSAIWPDWRIALSELQGEMDKKARKK